MLLDLQRTFHRAVLGGSDGDLPAHVNAPQGAVAARINVYRNTVQESLIDVLAAAFPVVRRIVGDDYFAVLARAFATSHPPRAPQLSTYGEAFPRFTSERAQDHRLPYLADVARLEWARAEAYFAADAAPLDPSTLVNASDVGTIRLAPHPAARLVRADFPIMTIWSANQPETSIVPEIDMKTVEVALVSRPGMNVVTRKISEGDAALLEALIAGATLGAAAEAALASEPSLNLQEALELHLRHATFAAR